MCNFWFYNIGLLPNIVLSITYFLFISYISLEIENAVSYEGMYLFNCYVVHII